MQEEALTFAHCPEECAEEWQGKKTERKVYLVLVLINLEILWTVM